MVPKIVTALNPITCYVGGSGIEIRARGDDQASRFCDAFVNASPTTNVRLYEDAPSWTQPLCMVSFPTFTIWVTNLGDSQYDSGRAAFAACTIGEQQGGTLKWTG